MNYSIIDQIDAEIARLRSLRKHIAAIKAGAPAIARVESRRARRVRRSGAKERIRVARWAK